MGRSIAVDLSFYGIVPLMLLLSCFSFTYTAAYDRLDPNGNVTIKWDVMSWTSDGYIAVVTIYNYQQYRHIPSPGWTLGWSWDKDEIIWDMVGSKTTELGNCSKFKGNVPHSCEKNPTVVDLLPGAPYNQQFQNCCKGGVLNSVARDPENIASSFEVRVGASGTSIKTVSIPQNFTVLAAGPGYTCGPAKIVRPTKFITADKRRLFHAMMTWNVTCTFSQFLAQKNPGCCVSLSSFYNDSITSCPACACGCKNNGTQSGSCVDTKSPYLASNVSGANILNPYEPLVQCSSHMCPIEVNWHVEQNYTEYWKVKITITNLNYQMNYSLWSLVVQHLNVHNITELSTFQYKSLAPHAGINDTAMFWGIKFYNSLLSQDHNVTSELLFRKDPSFTLDNGWAFPGRVFFNGENCVIPHSNA